MSRPGVGGRRPAPGRPASSRARDCAGLRAGGPLFCTPRPRPASAETGRAQPRRAPFAKLAPAVGARGARRAPAPAATRFRLWTAPARPGGVGRPAARPLRKACARCPAGAGLLLLLCAPGLSLARRRLPAAAAAPRPAPAAVRARRWVPGGVGSLGAWLALPTGSEWGVVALKMLPRAEVVSRGAAGCGCALRALAPQAPAVGREGSLQAQAPAARRTRLATAPARRCGGCGCATLRAPASLRAPARSACWCA